MLCIRISVLPAGICVCHVHLMQRSVTAPLDLPLQSCELPHWCWELNSGPLQEQQELLTIKPFLQTPLPNVLI